MIDLQPFCSTEETRFNLQKPFTRGDFTYATNGHIAVRAPKIEGVDEGDTACERVFPKELPALRALGSIEIPAPSECAACDGSGNEHECPDCSCACESCSGTGTQKISVKLRACFYDARYIRLVLSLPNVMFEADPPNNAGASFTFDGGQGVIMPMRLKTADVDAGDA